MDTFDTPATVDLSGLDPNGGVLVHAVYWRPQPKDANPDQPGEKLSMMSYLPTGTYAACRCGSGNLFGNCCQPLPHWLPVCPNPNREGHSLMSPQSALFSHIPTDAVYAFLQKDKRLYCVTDTPPYGFWVYWGDPVLYVPSYGTCCFGDFGLQKDGNLLVTATSDRRMEVLLSVLQSLNLGAPQMERKPTPLVKKPIRKVVRRKRKRR
jgi:hypothetical protein